MSFEQILITHESSQGKMKNQFIGNNKYEWEDLSLMDIFIGKIKNIYFTNQNFSEKTFQIEQKLNEAINKFNRRGLDYIEFHKRTNELFTELDKVDPQVNLYSTYSHIIDNFLSSYQNLILTGVGGIGKTQFLYEVSNHIYNRCENSILYLDQILKQQLKL